MFWAWSSSKSQWSISPSILLLSQMPACESENEMLCAIAVWLFSLSKASNRFFKGETHKVILRFMMDLKKRPYFFNYWVIRRWWTQWNLRVCQIGVRIAYKVIWMLDYSFYKIKQFDMFNGPFIKFTLYKFDSIHWQLLQEAFSFSSVNYLTIN